MNKDTVVVVVVVTTMVYVSTGFLRSQPLYGTRPLVLLVHAVTLFVLLCVPLVLPTPLVHVWNPLPARTCPPYSPSLSCILQPSCLSRLLFLWSSSLARVPPLLPQMGNWELSRVAPSKQLPRHVRDRVFSAYKEATKLEDDNYKAWHCWAMVRPLSLVRHTCTLSRVPCLLSPVIRSPASCPLSPLTCPLSPVWLVLSPLLSSHATLLFFIGIVILLLY